MPVGSDTHATRRHLPHFSKPGRTYFVTFSTLRRKVLEPRARDIALTTSLVEHLVTAFLHESLVMPDHMHLVLTPYDNFTLPFVLQRIKSVSSHDINRALGRKGGVWEEESFDRIVRSSEDLRKKCEYIAENPVRAGLVATPDEYPWLWREWVDGRK